MDKQAIKRHYELLCLAIIHNSYRRGNIDYTIFEHEGKTILFVYGSNELKDWTFNISYIGIIFHLGYFLLAKKISNVVAPSRKVVLVGHSLGAGVCSVLYWLIRKKVDEMILFACPPSYNILSPLKPKNTTNYSLSGDIVKWVSLITPFRQPVKTSKIDYSVKGIDEHYLSSYLKAMKNIVDKI